MIKRGLELLKKDISIDIIHTVLFAMITFFVLSTWVHHAFQGNYWGPFLPGANFGIPSDEKEILGMYPTSPVGWDAQFYYYQSNDLFIVKDAKKHIDMPAYRYQRIGVPLISGTIASLLGYKLTPPILYHYVQIFIISIGFFFLIRWLRENNLSSIYAYGWILSLGVINGLAFGMPDPVGDAFFIMSIILVLKRKLIFYAIITSLLLLVREGYASYAGIIFILTALNKIPWEKNNRLINSFFTAFPGGVLLAWSTFITVKLGQTFFQASKGANLTDLPFLGVFKTYKTAIESGNVEEMIFKVMGVFILIMTAYVVWKSRKNSNMWYAVLVYIFLVSMLGTTIWLDYSGYMKALGSLIAVVIILLPYVNNKGFYKVVLILIAIIGLSYNLYSKRYHLFTEYTGVASTVNNKSNIPNKKLTAFASEINPINLNDKWKSYRGLFSFAHREVKEINVNIKNTSQEIWRALPQGGIDSINASYQWFDETGTKFLAEGIRNPLSKDVLPNESIEMDMNIRLLKKGKYILKLSMLQEGVAWFYQVGGNFKDIPIEIK